MKKIALSAMTAALLFSACGKKANQASDTTLRDQGASMDTTALVGLAAPPHLIQDSLAQSMTHLGADLLRQLSQSDASANQNISPWSIASALTLVSSSARGQTQAELYQALHYNPIRGYENYYDRALKTLSDELHEKAQLRDPFSGEAQGNALHTANGIWTNDQNTSPLHEDFLRVARDYYAAEVQKAAFASSPAAVRDAINQWIAANTNDRIQDLIPPTLIQPSTSAILVNAIAFKIAWKNEFYEGATRPGAFTTAAGTTVQAQKMNQTINALNLVERDDFIAFDLPYAGGAYVMTIVLPNPGKHAQTQDYLYTDGGFAQLHRAMSEGESTRVDLSLPKFKFDASLDVRDALEALGIRAPFEDQADFSGLYASGQSNLKITDILHQAFIEVNEKGTDAAAATVVAISVTSMPFFDADPRVIDVDRPFFYTIRDTQHSTPLFMGVINDPTR